VSTNLEKIKAQSLAAAGLRFEYYKRHLIGPVELELLLSASKRLAEIERKSRSKKGIK
jgi:hypothetical protein